MSPLFLRKVQAMQKRKRIPNTYPKTAADVPKFFTAVELFDRDGRRLILRSLGIFLTSTQIKIEFSLE